jgi:dolichol-phosphate mannosyltransferase
MKRACIVLPTFNEADNVRVLLPRIFAVAARITSHEVHVLVVDDASPDGTQEVVRRLMEREPRLHLVTGRKQGLGVAYQRGFAHALAAFDPELIVQMDADLQHPPALLPLFFDLARHGYSVVIGSRFAPGGATPDFSWRRRLLSRVGNALVRTLGGLPRLRDLTSGYRCIRADLLGRVDLRHLSTRGYAFQTSLLSELLRVGARPIEVPMIFGQRGHGASKLTLRDQLEFVANLLCLRCRRIVAWAQRVLAPLARPGTGTARAPAPGRPPRLAPVPSPRPAAGREVELA